MATSKDQLFEKIDNLLIDINSQYLDLKSLENLDPVEVRLLAGNIDYLSSHVKALAHFIPSVEKNEHVAEETIFTPESNIADEEFDTQETYNEIEEVSNFIKEQSTNESIYTEIEDESIVAFEEIIESPVSTSLPSEEINTSSYSQQEVEEHTFVKEVTEEEVDVTIEETPKEDAAARPLSINELIHQQKKAGVNLTQQFNTSSVSSSERILDIKGAINLNDKLLFIKDLFNGYSLAYSEAIELLNRFDNYAEADAFLQSNYALKNGWSSRPQTVEKLYAILRKKYI